jgi:hypothetical protein
MKNHQFWAIGDETANVVATFEVITSFIKEICWKV